MIQTVDGRAPIVFIDKTVKSPTETVLERIVLEHKAGAAYLIADAYRGARIKEAVTHFLGAAAGNSRTTIRVDEKSLSSPLKKSSRQAFFIWTECI